MSIPNFEQITLQGKDTLDFLQGQITCNITKIGLSYQPTAIADLKGRIAFGLWIKQHNAWSGNKAQDDNDIQNDTDDSKSVDIVTSSDCMPALLAHLKKYGAFSKFTVSEPVTAYPCTTTATSPNDATSLNNTSSENRPTFSLTKDRHNVWEWMAISIATGNYWIVSDTQGKFQPQELRLHQRGGVDYDKGCYLGQEVIARIYFKSAPKAFLHRIRAKGATPNAGDSLGKIKVVNAIPVDSSVSEFEALVVATPDQLASSEADIRILELPDALQASVAREV